MKEVDCDNCSL